MRRGKKIKIVHKVIGFYLCNHIMIAVSILAIVGIGIRIIEEGFIGSYKSNAQQHMEYFDEELLNLKYLLASMMQSDSVLVLSEQYEQLSPYNKVKWKKQAREELIVLKDQYKWIEDMGIYIPELDLWITAVEWFKADEAIIKQSKGKELELINDNLYLTMRYERGNKYRESYIKFDADQVKYLAEKMRFNQEANIEIFINGEEIGEEILQNKMAYKTNKSVVVKSSLYPIEVNIYIPNALMSLGGYFCLFGIISILLLILLTIGFTKYLNNAIHKPLYNIVKYIEGMNETNFKSEIHHIGMDEFDYVTASLNKTKGLLEEYIRKSYEQEISMKQMELDQLQQQIKPHFLYNCFFNISSMCKTYDVDKIEQLTRGLAKYYRYITRTSHILVSLEEEYEHMKNYLDIQSIRFEGRVWIKIGDLPDSLKHIKVPRLILQPIVENSYKYVFDKIESGGYLYIDIDETETDCVIQIEDSGDHISEEIYLNLKTKIEVCESPITGLINIKRRLKHLNERNEILLERTQKGGMRIKLKISTVH